MFKYFQHVGSTDTETTGSKDQPAVLWYSMYAHQKKNRKTQPFIISEGRRGFWVEGRWREEVGHSLIHPLQEYSSTSVPWSLSLSLCKSLTQKRKWINVLDTAKRKLMPWTTGLEKLDHIIVRNGGRNLEWGHRGDTWHTSDLSSREREQEIRKKVILNEDSEECSRNEKKSPVFRIRILTQINKCSHLARTHWKNSKRGNHNILK